MQKSSQTLWPLCIAIIAVLLVLHFMRKDEVQHQGNERKGELIDWKLCTYNVHGFADRKWRETLQEMIDYFQKQQCDVISLNEVHLQRNNQKLLEEFAIALKMQYFFVAASNENYGNALLTKYNLTKTEGIIMRPADTVKYEVRSAAKASVQLSVDGKEVELPMQFYSLHIDQIDEDVRLEQLQQLKEKIDFSRPHIIMGDLNSLMREDYTEEYYQEKVYNSRKNDGWELPRFDVTTWFTSHGYTDLLRFLNSQPHESKWLKAASGSTERKAFDDTITSCFFSTRIDFVYAYSNGLQVVVKEVHVDHSIAASDHYPVIASIQFKLQ